MTSAASYAMRTAREVLVRVRELNPKPELALSKRTDLRFVSILYSGAGILTYPALGFYAVSLRFEGAAHLHEEGWGLGAVEAPAGGLFVQVPNRMVEYAWQEKHLGWAM